MTHQRIVVRGATLALTRRTMYRKAFLAPWDPLVPDIWTYALADAQRHTGVAVHSTTLCITHHHTEVGLEEPALAELLGRVHGDTSCALNALLIKNRYDAPRTIFDKRSTHVMRLMDAAAQLDQAVYDHTNPVAAGLVAKPEHMPGPVADFRVWKAGGVLVRRPDVYFDRSRPAELELKVTPPPLLLRAFDGDVDALVHHLQRLARERVAHIARLRKRPVLGAQKTRRIHPWTEPRTLAEPGGRRVPSFKVGARPVGDQEPADPRACALEITAWREQYRACSELHRQGDRDVEFPHGTDWMQRYHHVNVAPPAEDALISQPGPLLQEVIEECARNRSHPRARDEVPAHAALVEGVRDSLRETTRETIETEDLEFAEYDGRSDRAQRGDSHDGEAENDGDASDQARGPAPRVKHRFDPRAEGGNPGVPRVVTLRDKRRGRPPKGTAPPR